MSNFDDNIKDKRVLNHPLLEGYRKWSQEDWSKKDQLTDIFSGMKSPYNKKNRNLYNVVAEATIAVQDTFAQFDLPRQPEVRFIDQHEIKTAKDNTDQVVSGKLDFEAEFMTLTGVKKRAKISVTVAEGEVIPPSTMVVNGRVGIISQHEVTAMLERSTSYVLPQIRDMYDPPMSKEEREVAVEARNDFGWQPSNTETRNFMLRKENKKAQEESVINIADSIDDIQEVANRMTKLFMGIETLQADEYDEDFAVFSTNDPEYFVKVESDYDEVKLELIDSTTNELVFSKVLEKDFFQDEPDYEEMDYQRRMRGQSFDNTKQQIDNAVGDPEALAEAIASAPDYEEALKYASQQVPDSMEWMKTVRILSDAIDVPGVSGKKAQENSTGSSYEEELKNIKGLIEGLDVSDTEASGRINDMIFDIMERYGISESQVSWDLSRLHPEGIDLVVELNVLWGFSEDLENADSDSYDRLSSYILGSLPNLKEELINQEKYNDQVAGYLSSIEASLSSGDVGSLKDMFKELYYEVKGGPKTVAKKASTPSAYANVVILMEKAEEEGKETFPRSYDYLLRTYILEVVSTADKDAWMIPLINDGFCLNPYGQNLRTRKAHSFKVLDRFKRAQEIEKEIEMEVTDEPVEMSPRFYRDTKTPIELSDGVRFPGNKGNMRGTVVEFNPDEDFLIIKSKGMEYRVGVDDIEPLPSTFQKMYR